MVAFAILAVLMLAGALLVVTLRQPVHAALALVGTLLTLAVAYLQLNAHFLAAIQVIVYAGAIMVLFLFVIMLLNVRDDRMGIALPGLRPLAWIAGALGAGAVAVTLFSDPRPLPEAEQVALALGGGDAGRIADAIFGPFLLAFHLVGVLLLTGIVGAVGLVQRSPADARSRAASGARFPGTTPAGGGADRAPGTAAGERAPISARGGTSR